MNEAQTILDVEWVLVEEEVPTTALVYALTPDPVGAPTGSNDNKISQRPSNSGMPVPLVVALALVVAIAVVALPGMIFDLLSAPVLFGMLVVAVVATAVVVISHPTSNGKREHFWTIGSEPVGQCTASRITFTGR